MRRFRLWVFSTLSLACLATSFPSAAAILEVDCVTGPFFTIQSAVDVAVDGDTVVVNDCTYNEAVSIVGLDRVSLIVADTTTTGSYTTGVGALPSPTVTIDSSTTGAPCIRISLGGNITISGFRLANCDTYGIISDGGRNNKYHGNRIQNAAFLGINDFGTGTVITGNVIGLNGSGGLTLENTNDAYVADNRVALNGGVGIRIFGDLNHVVNNDVTSNTAEGIVVDGLENRIERNRATGNGGTANLLIDTTSTDADVVGNNTASSLVDSGTGTELADNS